MPPVGRVRPSHPCVPALVPDRRSGGGRSPAPAPCPAQGGVGASPAQEACPKVSGRGHQVGSAPDQQPAWALGLQQRKDGEGQCWAHRGWSTLQGAGTSCLVTQNLHVQLPGQGRSRPPVLWPDQEVTVTAEAMSLSAPPPRGQHQARLPVLCPFPGRPQLPKPLAGRLTSPLGNLGWARAKFKVSFSPAT